MHYLKPHLDQLYARYNHRQFVFPDPLQVVYDYPDPRDQEIVGLIAAALAFGGVQQILKSIGQVLQVLGDRPHVFLADRSLAQLQRDFRGFQYRYVYAADLCALLEALGSQLRESGALAASFKALDPSPKGTASPAGDILPVLSAWVDCLLAAGKREKNYLLPTPARGSACKRWHLYLRWMIRQDAVDPGAWQALLGSEAPTPARLLIPMDTHMYRLTHALGMTQRKQADLRTVSEVSAAFRRIAPEDPVRYDFAMTRLGIRRDPDIKRFVAACQGQRPDPVHDTPPDPILR